MFVIIIRVTIPSTDDAPQSINFIKSGYNYYLYMSGKSISAFKTVEEAQDCFGYKDCHNRDHTWSSSACIHWMEYNPVIYELASENPEDLRKIFFPTQESLNIFELGSIAGRVSGLAIEDETLAERLYSEGDSVELI